MLAGRQREQDGPGTRRPYDQPAPDLQGHAVLFARWADASMTSYYGYEQSGDPFERLKVLGLGVARR